MSTTIAPESKQADLTEQKESMHAGKPFVAVATIPTTDAASAAAAPAAADSAVAAAAPAPLTSTASTQTPATLAQKMAILGASIDAAAAPTVEWARRKSISLLPESISHAKEIEQKEKDAIAAGAHPVTAAERRPSVPDVGTAFSAVSQDLSGKINHLMQPVVTALEPAVATLNSYLPATNLPVVVAYGEQAPVGAIVVQRDQIKDAYLNEQLQEPGQQETKAKPAAASLQAQRDVASLTNEEKEKAVKTAL